ncbi:hypothetical protein [Allosphingosinicella sp.]|jgi:spore maturation protein CgeB|uniref:hypothetical protein n=1 Tax=Allosphingosinicella sp. TaxID=2823234 RepID=UPI002F161264
MRLIFALPLLAVAGCNVNNDEKNDQVTFEYNQQRIEDAASDVANTAGDVASGVANVASDTGQAIKNEVGDIDVDITRNRSGNAQ